MRSAPLIFPANIDPANLQQISHLTSYYFDFVTKSEQAGKTRKFGGLATLGPPLRLQHTSRFQNAANCDLAPDISSAMAAPTCHVLSADDGIGSLFSQVINGQRVEVTCVVFLQC